MFDLSRRIVKSRIQSQSDEYGNSQYGFLFHQSLDLPIYFPNLPVDFLNSEDMSASENIPNFLQSPSAVSGKQKKKWIHAAKLKAPKMK